MLLPGAWSCKGNALIISCCGGRCPFVRVTYKCNHPKQVPVAQHAGQRVGKCNYSNGAETSMGLYVLQSNEHEFLHQKKPTVMISLHYTSQTSLYLIISTGHCRSWHHVLGHPLSRITPNRWSCCCCHSAHAVALSCVSSASVSGLSSPSSSSSSCPSCSSSCAYCPAP